MRRFQLTKRSPPHTIDLKEDFHEAIVSRVCTALVTPFRLDFVHLEVYDQLLDRQLRAGTSRLVVCGTRRIRNVTDTERLDLVATPWFVEGRCKAGTGSTTRHYPHGRRKSWSADVLLVSPYYNKATERGSSPTTPPLGTRFHLPAIVYNVPSRTESTSPCPCTRPCPTIPISAA